MVYRPAERYKVIHTNWPKRYMSCVMPTRFSHINMRSRSVSQYDLKTWWAYDIEDVWWHVTLANTYRIFDEILFEITYYYLLRREVLSHWLETVWILLRAVKKSWPSHSQKYKTEQLYINCEFGKFHCENWKKSLNRKTGTTPTLSNQNLFNILQELYTTSVGTNIGYRKSGVIKLITRIDTTNQY